MQQLVDKIAKERKQHLDSIEQLTLQEINRIVSPFTTPEPQGLRAAPKD